MPRKILFIDRDGTLVKENAREEIRSFEDIEFVPGALRCLAFLRRHTDFEFVLVSNQDGLGTPSYPRELFQPLHDFIMRTFAGEGVTFDAEHIDCHTPEDNSPFRKPGTAMLAGYMDGSADMEQCFVVGDRETDAQLARNLGCRAIILPTPPSRPATRRQASRRGRGRRQTTAWPTWRRGTRPRRCSTPGGAWPR